MRTRVVVVGAGTAAGRLAAGLAAGDPDRRLDVTLVGDEPHPPYWRALLTSVLAGDSRFGNAAAHPRDWYRRSGVRLLLGRRVRALDVTGGRVLLDGDAALPYDRLVLATGGEQVLPEMSGLSSAGVLPMRTRGDCGRLLRHAKTARSAVVIGGGLLGVETARALARHVPEVTVVHRGPHLLSRLVPPGAGDVLDRGMTRLGVRVRTGVPVTGLRRRRGRLHVRLGDGQLAADVAVLACGSRPAAGLAAAAGLPVSRGVVVGDDLHCAEGVWAIGACAEHAGIVDDSAVAAEEQAVVAARAILGEPARYPGCRPLSRLRARDLEVAVFGHVRAGGRRDAEAGAAGGAAGDAAGDEDVLEVRNPLRGTFARVAVRGGRLASGVLVGDLSATATLVPAYDRDLPVPPGWRSLLLGGSTSP
jgi:assimilatory nitrate reductase electron transfer subunit